MTHVRITETEAGPVAHRPETELRPARRCVHGHLSPTYRGGNCVACIAAWSAARIAARPRKYTRRMRRHPDLQAARVDHEEAGGWLLDLGGGIYGVTDSYDAVRVLRGVTFMKRCEALQCWDETEMRPVRLRQAGQLAEVRAA